jgi:hypothetical protein
MARPSEFSQEVVNEICERMQAGETLSAICKDDHLPAKNTVLRWLDKNPPFQTQYARARTALMDHYADQIVEIAFEGSNADQVAVARDRLKIDTLKWLMSKLAHRKYGDRIALTGEDGGAIKHEISRIERVIVEPGTAFATVAAMPDPELLARMVGLIERRVLNAGQRSPKEVLTEVIAVIDRALIAEYG